MDGQKKPKPTQSGNYDLTDIPGEVWKDIEGYEGLYMVSNKGRIKSLERRVWNYTKRARIMRTCDNGHSYLSVGLTDKEKKKHKHVYVHILVATAFIPNPRGCKEVNHKDFDKSNNCAENLEWVTRQENVLHYRQSAYERRVEEKKNAKLFVKSVKRLRELRDPVLSRYASGMTMREIHEDLPGVGIDSIRAIIDLFDGWSLGTKYDTSPLAKKNILE